MKNFNSTATTATLAIARQILLLRSQLIRWSLKIVVVIFTLAGLTNFLVELQDADWGTGHGNMPFHDALYFVIVSFSTVGQVQSFLKSTRFV